MPGFVNYFCPESQGACMCVSLPLGYDQLVVAMMWHDMDPI